MSSAVHLLAFIVLLGGLVFIHELGHFLVAKFFKVKVLRFSLGFGPRLWGFKRGETEYQIAALPLGGYVKMLGEEPTADTPPEDRGRGFAEQKPYRRAIIAFAGPGVNLLIPVVLYFLMNLTPQLENPPVVGAVLPNEPAERAGVQPGDRVVSVAGVATPSFEQMHEEIEARPGQPFDLVVDRAGEQKTLHVTPTTETEKNVVETTSKGKIGVMIGKTPSYIGVVSGSRAYQAGLRTFDRVVSVNGQSLTSTVELETALKKAGDAPLTIGVVREAPLDLKTASVVSGQPVTVTVPAGAGPLGLERADLYIREVPTDSKAYAAGVRPGDKVVALDGVTVSSVIRFQWMLTDKETLHLTLERGAEHVNATYDVVHYERHDPLLGPIPSVDLGFQLHPRIFASEPFAPSEMVKVSYPVGKAFTRSIHQTVVVTRTMVLGIGALFTGKVSMKGIGGPIQLFQLAGVAADDGLATFLQLFVLISINLGLMNLLPIPVLDGGHILVAGIEGISRRAVPMKVRAAAQWVGVVLLLALMALAFKNDVFRVLGL
jgi:regulator of sigma E protease